jgi:hypothetical protein
MEGLTHFCPERDAAIGCGLATAKTPLSNGGRDRALRCTHHHRRCAPSLGRRSEFEISPEPWIRTRLPITSTAIDALAI